jgi:hypothetical protein
MSNTMKRPPKRPIDIQRNSDNCKRKLVEDSDIEINKRRLSNAFFKGYAKHKAYPRAFGLPPFQAERGDATLCDRDAGFQSTDSHRIPDLLQRGITAGLIGERMIWTIDDNGWIYELRLTNRGTDEYHGYPVRSTEAIAEIVFRRYEEWAKSQRPGSDVDAVEACRDRYGFR